MFAVALDDRALAMAVDGELRSLQPSVVYRDGGGERTGRPAWNVQREHPAQVATDHWAELAREPVPPAAAALATAELRERLATLPGSGVTENPPSWLLAPATFEAGTLGAVLSIARAAGLAPAGFVDASVVTTAALGLEGPVLVLELGLHHLAATTVICGDRVRRGRVSVGRCGGLIDLYQGWLQMIAAAMVKRTRFDPLHEGSTEQQLFSALPALAREAAGCGMARAALEVRGECFEVELSRDQFAQAARDLYRELLRLVHELRPAGMALTIVAPAVMAELPGLRAELEQLSGCELVAIYDGLAAVAATRLRAPLVGASAECVPLLRALPRRASVVVPESAIAARWRLGSAAGALRRPTHLLFAGRAVELGEGPLEIGRGHAVAAGAIRLPEGLAGVSRRHCSLRREGDGVLLIDHSRFGTRVNGERVAGRVQLHAGDRLRIGDPGVELDLIAVGE